MTRFRPFVAAACAGLIALAAGPALAQMAMPVMTSHGQPSNSANRYATIVDGSNDATAVQGVTGTVFEMPLPIAMTASNFQVRCPSNVSAGTWDFYVQLNGATPGSGAQHVQCSSANPNGYADNTDTTSFAAGQHIGYLIEPTGPPTAQGNGIQTSILLTSAASNKSAIFFAAAPVTSTSLYMPPMGTAPSTFTTLAQAEGVVSTPGTIQSIYATVSAPPGAGVTITFTVYQNEAATGCSTQISGTTQVDNHAACSLTVAAGDRITVEHTVSGGTPPNHQSAVSVEFDPTTNGASNQFAVFTGSNSGTRYVDPTGSAQVQLSSSETLAVNVAPGSFQAQNLYLMAQTAPGSGTWTVATRKGMTGTLALGTSLTGTSTLPMKASDLSSGDYQSFGAGDLLDFQITSGASPPNGQLALGWTAYVNPSSPPPTHKACTLMLLEVGSC